MAIAPSIAAVLKLKNDNYRNGREAEKVAANYLKKLGYKILAFNWRTRWCEIDIVAQKARAVSIL